MRDHLSIVENNLIQNYKKKELSTKIKAIKKGIDSCDQSAQTTAEFFSQNEVRSIMEQNNPHVAKRFSNATSDVALPLN